MRRRYSFWIDEADAQALKTVKEREGILESEQIRRALKAWLRKRQATRAGRGRMGGRKRA